MAAQMGIVPRLIEFNDMVWAVLFERVSIIIIEAIEIICRWLNLITKGYDKNVKCVYAINKNIRELSFPATSNALPIVCWTFKAWRLADSYSGNALSLDRRQMLTSIGVNTSPI